MSGIPELPENWKWEKLGELGILARGQSKHRPRNSKHLYGSGYPFVQTGDVRNAGNVLSTHTQTYSEEGLKQSKLWPKGTLCITIAANIAETAILGFDACFPDSIVGFIPNEEFDVKYFNYFIQTAKEDLDRYAPATAQKNINLKILSEVAVPIAPLPEQRRIVSKIEELFSKLDAGVAALKHAKAQLKRYRQSVLAAAVTGELTKEWRANNPNTEPASKLLERILEQRREQWTGKGKYKEPEQAEDTNLPTIPSNWLWTNLEQIGFVIGGVTKNGKRNALPNKVPYLRVANVYASELRLEEIKEIGVKDSELDKLLVQKGDLLIVEGNGSKDQIGRLAIWDGSIHPCIHQNHLIKVRLIDTKLAKYVATWLLSSEGRKHIVRVASSTSGLYTLSVSKVSKLPTPLPPIEEQKQIVSEVEARTTIIDHIETELDQQLTRSNRLRQSILSTAFSGTL